MNTIIRTTGTSSSPRPSDLPSPPLSFSIDCSIFLNWSEDQSESVHEPAVIYRSLVATVKLQPIFDGSLEAKAIKFLKSVIPQTSASADAFLHTLASNSDESLTNFIQSIVVLISSPHHAITTAVMKMLSNLIWRCSMKFRLALVKANLIPQLLISLNPQSLSFEEAKDIHIHLMSSIECSLYLITPLRHGDVEIEDRNSQQDAYQMVLQQVIVPSEKYIWHLCMNRFSIVHGDFSTRFLLLLPALLQISPFYQRTLDFVFHMPIILTIPSYLTFIENDGSIFDSLFLMIDTQQEWNRKREETREMQQYVHQMLRMEGIEDVMETKLRNDQNAQLGRLIVDQSIGWNNQQGMNLPEQ